MIERSNLGIFLFLVLSQFSTVVTGTALVLLSLQLHARIVYSFIVLLGTNKYNTLLINSTFILKGL